MTKDEITINLNDAILMRVAQRVRPDFLYPLAANLLDNVEYLEHTKADFAEMKTSETVLLNLVEWKRRVVNERGDISAEALVKIIRDAGLDEHIMCQVCKRKRYDY